MLKLKTKIPKKPGVYFFKNKKREILYIGKAADLRNRLRSYFSKSVKDARILSMLKNAAGVSWQKTDSEIEALILESQLIKKYRPVFNVLMRDDKQYFYVVFTKENFPKIFISHQQKDIGPFTNGAALKTTLRMLRRIFPYCTCKKPHNNYCLNYHIENCLGYCCLKDESGIKNYELGVYKENIRAIKDVLGGKRVSLAKQLEKEMKQAAKNGDFEGAIKARKQLASLNKIFKNAKIISKPPEDSPRGVLGQLKKVLKLPQIPHRIEAYDISNIQGTRAVGSMTVFTDGQSYTAEPSGFRPDKSQYRKFKIKSKSSPDDTAMLKEVISRRFTHKEWPLPDLVIVDGGKAQLNATRPIVLKQIPIIAIAKNKKHKAEKIHAQSKGSSWTVGKLPKNVQNLLVQINNEAHRFAISYYRKTHRKIALI